MIDNSDGRRWARAFLFIALFVSMVGNVTHTVLADSSISLWLRVPGAILWPAFTFGGIEIIVRMIWERRWTHSFARNMVLFPAVPAAIISYEHLYSLLLMMGEKRFIAFIGPLAIDGMMVGCTMALLFTRKVSEQLSGATVFVLQYPAPIGPMPAPIPASREWSTEELIEAPVSPAPVSTERAARAPRSEWNARAVAEMAIDGAKAREIHEKIGVPMSTAGRFAKVARTLRANPQAEIAPAEKVHPEHIRIMRELISR